MGNLGRILGYCLITKIFVLYQLVRNTLYPSNDKLWAQPNRDLWFTEISVKMKAVQMLQWVTPEVGFFLCRQAGKVVRCLNKLYSHCSVKKLQQFWVSFCFFIVRVELLRPGNPTHAGQHLHCAVFQVDFILLWHVVPLKPGYRT